MIPTVTTFVERLGEWTKNGKRRKTKTHKHHRLTCGTCGAVMLSASTSRACRLTWGCTGKMVRGGPETGP